MSNRLLKDRSRRGGFGAAAWTFFFAAAVVSGCGGERQESGDEADKGKWVEICGRRWQVRLALTWQEHERGLEGVGELREDEGMLFVFDRARVQEFWMRGCLIPLDVAFIDAGGRVVKKYTMPVVAEGREPPTYSSGEPVLFALEVAAGGLEAAGVRVGDPVTFSPEISRAIKGRGRR